MNQSRSDFEELRALNARLVHDYVTNDARSHGAVTHPRFLYLSPSGARVDRATYLRNWARAFDPNLMPYWDMRDERIDVFGDVALVRATNRYVLCVDGRETTGMSTYTDTYIREDGRWLRIQAQVAEVAQEHWPDDETIVCRYVEGKPHPIVAGLDHRSVHRHHQRRRR